MTQILHSIVEYYDQHEAYRCGYCKKPDTNFSYGLWAHSLTVSDYQDLIDRGWRRSGKYCYKPTMDVTCCPLYTIRCNALEFKATKSQKKVLKKFNKFLSGEELEETKQSPKRKISTCSSEASDGVMEGDFGQEQFVETSKVAQDIDVTNVKVMEPGESDKLNDVSLQNKRELSSSSTLKPNAVEPKSSVKKGVGKDPTKGPCQKAKLFRKERKLEKLKAKGMDIDSLVNKNVNREKQLEDFLNELPSQFKDKLEIRLVRTNPPSAEYTKTVKQAHALYVKYQMQIHGERPEKNTMSKFKDFLVQSPLQEMPASLLGPSDPSCGYGSFHQQYWLEDKLIAVGVIDILPKCVSSVYFFYDPHYMHLSMGNFGAVREIAFTRSLNAEAPELKYYYMGFYIHSCPKMRYKGNFAPSYLLCPETYKWFPIHECIPKIEISPYSRLSSDVDEIDDNYPTRLDINYIPVLVKGVVLLFKNYMKKKNSQSECDEVMRYMRLVGSKAGKSLILAR